MPNYFGDAYTGCRPECIQNSDCPSDKSCLNTQCVNPCAGACSPTAECQVERHQPVCSCPTGSFGNAMIRCQPIQHDPPPSVQRPSNPCHPSPCGQYSNCRVLNDRPVCTCLPDSIGQPPYCRPECVASSDCARDKSCVNQKCIDPCAGTCGFNAECRVVNHNPICSCSPLFTGDPFVQCLREGKISFLCFQFKFNNNLFLFVSIIKIASALKQSNQRLSQTIPAYHHLVVPTRFVVWSMIGLCVLVQPLILVVPRTADRNA